MYLSCFNFCYMQQLLNFIMLQLVFNRSRLLVCDTIGQNLREGLSQTSDGQTRVEATQRSNRRCKKDCRFGTPQ